MAGILAGSTRAGADKATGLSGAQALIHMSQQGFGGSAALAGMLGVGSFMNGGKFDTSRCHARLANFKKHRPLRQRERRPVPKRGPIRAGVLRATGAILKNVEKFQAGVKRVATDTKTFDQTFEEVTDTLSHRLEELKNTSRSRASATSSARSWASPRRRPSGSFQARPSGGDPTGA
jgi:hypothetical protein